MKNVIKFLKDIPKNNAKSIFLIDGASGDTLTFNDLHIVSCKIGNYLLSKGYMKGDRIAILMDNSTALVKLYFGYSTKKALQALNILTPKQLQVITRTVTRGRKDEHN